MSYQAAFGSTLQTLRLKQNLSQAELALSSQLDRTFISLLERGIRQPTLTTIFQLSDGLNIKPSELILEVEKKLRRRRWKRLSS